MLDVSVRTIRRYNATGYAPRSACLALYWLTEHGRREVHSQATNDATIAVGYLQALRNEVKALSDTVEHLKQIGEFGSANEPGRRLPTRPKHSHK